MPRPLSFSLSRLARAICLSALLQILPSAAETPLPQACTQSCASTYGTVLGETDDGVAAYSNCRPDCVVPEPNREHGTYTGIRWQCVEFARRWLLIERGAVYGDVDVAADIWHKIDHLTRVPGDAAIPLENHENGSKTPPKIGDLLIYGREFEGTGHVAVITGITAEGVEVAEQNFANLAWNGTHARTIPMIRHGEGYWLLDPYLLGWKRIVETANEKSRTEN